MENKFLKASEILGGGRTNPNQKPNKFYVENNWLLPIRLHGGWLGRVKDAPSIKKNTLYWKTFSQVVLNKGEVHLHRKDLKMSNQQIDTLIARGLITYNKTKGYVSGPNAESFIRMVLGEVN